MKSGRITFTRRHSGRCFIGAPEDKMQAILDLAREFLREPFVDSTAREMKAVAEELLDRSGKVKSK